MLLRHMLLFLNILVAQARKRFMPTDGWDSGGKPLSGDVFWMYFHQAVPSERLPTGRVPWVVLPDPSNVHDDIYCVRAVRIFYERTLKVTVGLPATDFFEDDAKLGTYNGPVDFTHYRVLPHESYEFTGGPTDMIIYRGESVRMPKEAVDRLVTASEMVDGWDTGQVPLFGGVYWILPSVFGIKAKSGVYIPCVVLMHQHENKYRVVRMSNRMPNIPLPRGPAETVKEFLVEGSDIEHLKNYNIYPQEAYDVKCEPKIMQRRGKGPITQLRADSARILMAKVKSAGVLVVVSGMVDGWSGHLEPLFGGIYWIPLHIEAEIGLYIPCVVLGPWPAPAENGYLVVKMSDTPLPHGPAQPVGNNFLFEGNDIHYLRNCHIYPNENFVVEASPKNMRKWGMAGPITQLQPEFAHILRERVNEAQLLGGHAGVWISGTLEGWQKDQVAPVIGGIYWIPLKIDDQIELYACLVLKKMTEYKNKYLVVVMSNKPSLRGPALPVDIGKFSLEGNDIDYLRNCHIYPNENHAVEGDPKIMRRWRTGRITQVQPYYVHTMLIMIAAERDKHPMRV